MNTVAASTGAKDLTCYERRRVRERERERTRASDACEFASRRFIFDERKT